MRREQKVVPFALFLHPNSLTGLLNAAAALEELLIPVTQDGSTGSSTSTSSTQPKAQQINRLLHICFTYSLNINMEEPQEMTGWLLILTPCNTHILRAPTGRLIYQNKHTKKGRVVCPHISNRIFNFPA